MADRDPQSVEARLENAKTQLEHARERAVVDLADYDELVERGEASELKLSKARQSITAAIAETDAALDLVREDA